MPIKTYHKTLMLLCLVFALSTAKSQTKEPTATEKAADAICNKLSGIDINAVSGQEILKVFEQNLMKEFSANSDALLAEMGFEELSADNGRKIGEEIGKKLLVRCPKFIDVSLKIAKEKKGNPPEIADEINETYGTISKIVSPDFTTIVVKDATGRETTFYWLRFFKGSDKFESATANNVGKKIKLTWTEMECYLPKAHGYYKIKEIKSIDFVN